MGVITRVPDVQRPQTQAMGPTSNPKIPDNGKHFGEQGNDVNTHGRPAGDSKVDRPVAIEPPIIEIDGMDVGGDKRHQCLLLPALGVYIRLAGTLLIEHLTLYTQNGVHAVVHDVFYRTKKHAAPVLLTIDGAADEVDPVVLVVGSDWKCRARNPNSATAQLFRRRTIGDTTQASHDRAALRPALVNFGRPGLRRLAGMHGRKRPTQLPGACAQQGGG